MKTRQEAKDDRRQTSVAMERYGAPPLQAVIPDILICNVDNDFIFKRKEREKTNQKNTIARKMRQCSISFGCTNYTNLIILSHQDKSSINVDRLTSNVSASVKRQYQFHFNFVVDESYEKRTSSRTSTRLQSRQRRLHV